LSKVALAKAARRADVTGLGVPEHHGHDSSLTIIVKRGNVSHSNYLCLEIWLSGDANENPFFG
jgi:hypothetical protein